MAKTAEIRMPAYLVRIIETRDLVGIFVADDEGAVQRAVDECTDVPDCEYVEVPSGGVMWESPAVPVPLDTAAKGDDEDAEIATLPWSGASLTEGWWNFVHGFEDAEWTPFCPDAPPRGDNNPSRAHRRDRVELCHSRSDFGSSRE